MLPHETHGTIKGRRSCHARTELSLRFGHCRPHAKLEPSLSDRSRGQHMIQNTGLLVVKAEGFLTRSAG